MMEWSGQRTGGVFVTTPTREALLTSLAEHMRQRRGFTVATINLDHTVKLRQNAAFSSAYADHTHIVADGNPIVWLARLAGQAQVELVPGSDITAPVAALAAEEDVPVALFGATDATLAMAAASLEAANPALRIVARIAPAYGFDPTGSEADAAIARLAGSGARLVFLALGAPKQEVFAARAALALPEAGFLSIGAGLDFLAGSQKRAPELVRRLTLEWLWRLMSNPRRLAARYGACFAILPRLTLRAMRTRFLSPRSGTPGAGAGHA
jgi:exopolysaccharide biosynthesis WecB/TagA/CpsF family protein